MNREIHARFCERPGGKLPRPTHPPIKAGRNAHGRMKIAYFWPVYGEHDEICFPFSPSREGENVVRILGKTPAPGSVLLTDGYGVYASYAKQYGLIHAQCWSHSRRELFEAEAAEPEAVREGLTRIAAIYAVEEEIRDKNGYIRVYQ